jgi:ubiquinone/menaquinone biosynthesis C-methylase UbiE
MDPYVSHQLTFVCPYLTGARTLLDFGCGDLKLGKAIAKNIPALSVTGVDIVPTNQPKEKNIEFILTRGKTLPFQKNAFDAALSYHVLHHCQDPSHILDELIRVSKKTIILVEPVLRLSLEKPGFILVDILTNLSRIPNISFPFSVKNREWWEREFRRRKLKIRKEESAGVLPTWLPIGTTICFVLEKSTK